jgi:hypothetical protein
MKQTAVEWLIEELNDNGFSHLDLAADIIEQAKEMEKEQIKDAFDEGNPNGFIIKCGEEYYNETFKNEIK